MIDINNPRTWTRRNPSFEVIFANKDGTIPFEKVVDALGRRIEVGDTILYAVTSGRSAALDIGVVYAIDLSKETSWKNDRRIVKLKITRPSEDWDYDYESGHGETKIVQRKITIDYLGKCVIIRKHGSDTPVV